MKGKDKSVPSGQSGLSAWDRCEIMFFCGYLEVMLAGFLHVLYSAAVGFLQPLLPALMLQLHFLQLLSQVLSLLTELGLQLLQGMLGLGKLHLQALFQQGNLHTGSRRRWLINETTLQVKESKWNETAILYNTNNEPITLNNPYSGFNAS